MIVSGWKIDRGRNSELERNSPGKAQVGIIDTNGEADPTNPLSYSFTPMTPAALSIHNPVASTDHTVFRGWVEKFDYDLYQSEDYAVGTLDLIDGMDVLNAAEMTTMTYGDVIYLDPNERGNVIYYEDDQVAHRINQVLDDANFPGGLREVFSGNVKVRETTYAPRTTALTACLDAADAEFPGVANFYFQKDGRATFHGRLARFKPNDVQYHITTWRCGDTAAVQADSTRALIFELQYDRSVDKILNSVLSTPQGLADSNYGGQLVQDATSIAAYGTRSRSFENLLTLYGYLGGTGPRDETRKFATYYVDNFAQPRVRVNRITFKTLPPTHLNAQRNWNLICNVEISDIIRLKTTHQAGGFDEDFYVEGLHYIARPWTDQYDHVTLTLDVSPAAYYTSNPLD